MKRVPPMKQNTFLCSLSASYSRLRHYLDSFFSPRSFHKAPVGIQRFRFNPSLELLEGRYAMSSDIVVGGLQFRVINLTKEW